jgi:hypothetical protein
MPPLQRDRRSTVETFWFAKTLPGMPVRFTSEVAGQMVSAVVMVSDSLQPNDVAG